MKLAESEISTNTSPNLLPHPGGWRLAAAQKRGTSHEATGEVCQDAYSLAMLSPETLVIAIADGAGSARYAEDGAGLVVSHGIGALCARLDGAGTALDETILKDILHEGMVAARNAVEAEASVRQVSAHDLAATLILLIARPELIAAAQVGDGAIVIADETGKIIGLTLPPLEEYINETTFITSAEALRTAQTIVWRGRAVQLAAFSDGLQLLCLKWPKRLPHEAFFSPLFHFMGNMTDELQAGHELGSFLSSERIKELTDDDLTLVLASLTDYANVC
jgi:hypothetical protein